MNGCIFLYFLTIFFLLCLIYSRKMIQVMLKVWTASQQLFYLIGAFYFLTNYKQINQLFFYNDFQIMKNSQPHENARQAKFHEFKQLQYFKQILRRTQDFHLKQILPMYVYKLSAKILNHQKYVYIPQKTTEQCLCGIVVDQSITEFSKKVTVFRIDKKMDLILRHVIELNIPVLQDLKMSERFLIFNQCLIQRHAFNRIVFKKGQQLRGVYFIIQGQLKICPQKSIDSGKIVYKNNFVGLSQLQNQSYQYNSTIISNCNQTQLLFISCETLFNFKLQQIQSNLKQLLVQYHRKLEEEENILVFQNASIITKRKLEEQKKMSRVPLRLNNFVKKSEQFMIKTTKQDEGFNQYIRSKKILLQLRETMAAAKLSRKNRIAKIQPVKVLQAEKKHSKLNTNLQSCRSTLLKQNILKRLSWSKTYEDGERLRFFDDKSSFFNFKQTR